MIDNLLKFMKIKTVGDFLIFANRFIYILEIL